MTPEIRHSLPLLDGVRGLAAVLVVITHVAFQTGEVTHGAWGAVLARCDVGVAVFFVLSGFLLTRPWVRRGGTSAPSPSTRTYAIRRAARILPAYWLVLVVVLATTARGSSPDEVVANVSLLQVYTGALLPGYTQTWSLCTEVAFYVLLPLLAPTVARRAAHRRGLLVVVATTVVVTAAWIVMSTTDVLPRRAGEWLPGHLDWFVAGMLLACAEGAARRRPRSRPARLEQELAQRPWGLLAVVLTSFWLACTPLAGPRTLNPATPLEALAKELLYAVVAFGLVVWALAAHRTAGPSARLLGSRASQLVGRVSYGVFLWHLVLMAGIFALFDVALFSGGFFWILGLTLLATLVVSWASWTLLEQPVLSRAHRSGGARPTGPALARR